MDLREIRGRVVRAIWHDWASRQPDPKPSWLVGWDKLDDGQREVDMRIGEGVAAAERDRLLRVFTKLRTVQYSAGGEYPIDYVSWANVLSALGDTDADGEMHMACEGDGDPYEPPNCDFDTGGAP